MTTGTRTARTLTIAVVLACTTIAACTTGPDDLPTSTPAGASPTNATESSTPATNAEPEQPAEAASVPLDNDGLITLVESELDSIETMSVNKVDATDDFQQRTTDTVVDFTRSPLAARSTITVNGSSQIVEIVMVDNVSYLGSSTVAPGKWVTYADYPATLVDAVDRLRATLAINPAFSNQGPYTSRDETVTMYAATTETIPAATHLGGVTSWEIYIDDAGGLYGFKYGGGAESNLVRVDDVGPHVIEAPPSDQILSDQEARDLGLRS